MGLERYSGASHFANNESFEVQRTNHFELVIDGLTDISASADFEETIRLAVKSVSAPQMTVAAQDIKHGNETIRVASAPEYNDIDISIYDLIGRDVQGLFQEWFYKIFDPVTHQMGLVKDYKKNATLYMYSPDSTRIRIWTLYGVFPTSIGSDDYSNESSDLVSVNITLSVDKAVEGVLT